MAKRGFTLTELLITLVILAVLAAIALPNFQKTADKVRLKEAVAALHSIRAGEKMYFSRNGTYVDCGSAADIKNLLGVEVAENTYRFSVNGASAASFNAIAKKTTCLSWNVKIDQAGVQGVNSLCS